MAEKADLQAKAKDLGLDDSGTIPELKARIAEQEAAVVPQTDAERDAENARKDAEEAKPTDPEDDAGRAAKLRAEFDEARAAETNAVSEKKAAEAKAEKERIDAEKVPNMLEERGAEQTAKGKVKFPTIGDNISPKDAERAAKDASLAAGDGRESASDAAPGKPLADVLERNEARARGEFSGLDEDTHPLPAQFFIVTDELDLIEVARKLGLHDHSELGAINGRYSGVYGVQRGQRVVLPAHYRFDGIDGVVTEGDESDDLAGSEPTA